LCASVVIFAFWLWLFGKFIPAGLLPFVLISGLPGLPRPANPELSGCFAPIANTPRLWAGLRVLPATKCESSISLHKGHSGHRGSPLPLATASQSEAPKICLGLPIVPVSGLPVSDLHRNGMTVRSGCNLQAIFALVIR